MKNPKIQVNVPVKVNEEFMTINDKKTSVYKSVDRNQYVFSSTQIKKALGINDSQLNPKFKLLYNDYLASNDAVSSIEEMKVFSIECRKLLVNSTNKSIVSTANYKPYKDTNFQINLFSSQTVYYLVKAIQKASKKTNVKLILNCMDLISFLVNVCKVKQTIQITKQY